VPLERDGHEQTAFRVTIRDIEGRLVRDSGVFSSADPWWIVSPPLPAHAEFRWSVSTCDERGAWSAAAQADLETGPLEPSDWAARWIPRPTGAMAGLPFTVDRSVRRARLHVTAQGLVRVAFDGVQLGDGDLNPSRTDVGRALYRTFDVTDLCDAGPHRVSLGLGLGQWHVTGLDPRVLAEVVIEHHDGSVARVGTGSGAEAAVSPVVVDEPFYLERHDLRQMPTFGPGDGIELYPDGDIPLAPPQAVAPDPSPRLRRMPGRPVRELHRREGRRIVDVGENIAGVLVVRVIDPVAPGTVLRLVHGEHLDAGGLVDTTNLSLPADAGRVRQAVEFVLAGTGDEVAEAWFSYAGFRYVELSGLPECTAIEVTACPLHSEVEPTGDISCDAPSVERLVTMGRRTRLNTMHGVPEDCPTREQAAWTGDSAAAIDFDLAAFDLEALYSKWLDDLITSQGLDGSIPAIAPRIGDEPAPTDPVWGSALPRLVLQHWRHYGDRRVLDRGLVALRRWTSFLLGCVGPLGVVDGAPISFGHDWLGLHQTPPELHHTTATVEALDTLAELEEAVGRLEEATAARGEAARLRASAGARFVDEATGWVANGSQGAQACALEAGLAPQLAALIAGRLTERIAADGRITSGFATTRAVVRGLSAAGADQMVFDALTNPEEPGIGAMLDHGPGTFWECWWIDPANTGTGSLDHHGLGAPFAAWAYRSLLGVEPTAAGYRVARFDPHPVDGVDRITAELATVRGVLRVAWRRVGDDLQVELTVPVSMEVDVPRAGRRFRSGEHRLTLFGAGRMRRSAPEPVPGAAVPIPFVPPVRAPRPADLDRDPDLIGAALAAGAIHGMGATRVEVLPDGIVCMPVPHEQEPGPVLRAVAPADTDAALVAIDVDLDLRGAAFVVARLDFDLPMTGRRIRPVLRLCAADGSTRESSDTRIWPAGWSRVGVDVGGWPGAAGVHRIEVGARFEGEPDNLPGAVHIGGLGWSMRPRRW